MSEFREGPLNYASFGPSRRFVEGEDLEIAVAISEKPILASSAPKPPLTYSVGQYSSCGL